MLDSPGIHFGHIFCDFSVIWGAKIGDSFQVHVFGDPGMEMMPDCGGCMCLKHSKYCVFTMISLFQVFSVNWCPGGGFRCHFGHFW